MIPYPFLDAILADARPSSIPTAEPMRPPASRCPENSPTKYPRVIQTVTDGGAPLRFKTIATTIIPAKVNQNKGEAL